MKLTLLIFAVSLTAQESKPPTAEQLQQQLAVRDAQIAQLKQELADAKVRSRLGWGYFNFCIENAVATEKQVPQQAKQDSSQRP